MTQPLPKDPLKHLRASDIRGITKLITQATLGVTGIVEDAQQSVWSSLGFAAGKTPDTARGIAGMVFKSVRGVTELVGAGLDAALSSMPPDGQATTESESPEREAVVAALNGVLGDRMVASNNPLATPMTVRYQGKALNLQALPAELNGSAKILLLIHGSCMNDLQWQAQHQAQVVDHGAELAKTLGYTPLYLRYNSGLHISQNGHTLAELLDELVAAWPTPVHELTIVAHSMGGLVTRSAHYYATQSSLRWPQVLKNIVFLGTPHHGSPLERAGNWVDVILGGGYHTKPYAKLAQLRSAGVTDLRYGYVLDQDWAGQDRFRRTPDRRQVPPLPSGVACYTVAATTAAQRSALADRLVGDGLVPLNSALGKHDDAARCLVFSKESQRIFYRMNHLQLLSNPEVTQQLVKWLRPA